MTYRSTINGKFLLNYRIGKTRNR